MSYDTNLNFPGCVAAGKVCLVHRSNFFVLWILDFGEQIKLQPVVTSQWYLITSVIVFRS